MLGAKRNDGRNDLALVAYISKNRESSPCVPNSAPTFRATRPSSTTDGAHELPKVRSFITCQPQHVRGQATSAWSTGQPRRTISCRGRPAMPKTARCSAGAQIGAPCRAASRHGRAHDLDCPARAIASTTATRWVASDRPACARRTQVRHFERSARNRKAHRDMRNTNTHPLLQQYRPRSAVVFLTFVCSLLKSSALQKQQARPCGLSHSRWPTSHGPGKPTSAM